MVQLILDVGGESIQLPESQKGGYSPKLVETGMTIQMIGGRRVRELRDELWQIEYSYGYFSAEDWRRLLSVLERGRKEPLVCSFLPTPDSSHGQSLSTSQFWVSYTPPKFMWSNGSGDEIEPLWGGCTITLEEVQSSRREQGSSEVSISESSQ